MENEKNIEDRLKIGELLKEREALIANLLKANRTSATGALSASIAHELNQPLGASNLNIQFLRMKLDGGLLNDDISREVLDSLEADNKRAANIVRSLRSIFTEGESPVQECHLRDLIANVLTIASPELKSHNIRLDLKIEDGLMVWINASEMEQVILNLINNAMQSLGKKDAGDRVIVIEAQKMVQSVQLRVIDNGYGVPKEFKANLFELLNTTKKSGMGLGLWLCKHIVTRSGGSIWYEDDPDRGAIFIVELPSAG
jgi:C4-dicarboxylate-specific signal transduction histidine kinase